MNAISANQLKTRGVSVLAEELQSEPEAIITVRGKDQYVVMRIEQYHYLEKKGTVYFLPRRSRNQEKVKLSPFFQAGGRRYL